MFRLIFSATAAALLLHAGAANAQPQTQPIPCAWIHFNAPNMIDPGAQTPLPSGGTQIKYTDGWTTTVEPDSSYGAGGIIIIERDEKGAVRQSCKFDPKKIQRTEVTPDYAKRIMRETFFNAKGIVISTNTEKF